MYFTTEASPAPTTSEKKYVDFPPPWPMAIYLEDVHITTLVYFDSTTEFHCVPKFKCHELLHLVRISTIKIFCLDWLSFLC